MTVIRSELDSAALWDILSQAPSHQSLKPGKPGTSRKSLYLRLKMVFAPSWRDSNEAWIQDLTRDVQQREPQLVLCRGTRSLR